MDYKIVKVERKWLLKAVEWGCRIVMHAGDRESMNQRSLTERLDDIIMGEIGSTAVMQYLIGRGNNVIAYNNVREDEYRDPDPGWDLTVGPTSNGYFTLSVKASRIPKVDNDFMGLVMERRDFKVLVESDRIEWDLRSDYEVQVYFSLQSSVFDGVEDVSMRMVQDEDADMVLKRLRLPSRYGTCSICGFASREAIVAHSRGLAKKGEDIKWTSHHAGSSKKMWIAPLSLGIINTER